MFNSQEPYILVFGASVVDIIGFTNVSYIPLNSNPGSVKISYGGVCRNIAENMARVGLNTKFISILGNDETGRGMLEHSRMVGYDMEDSLITQNGGTPTYMAVLNECGEMVSAVVDMKSINELTTGFIDEKTQAIENAEYVIVDTDNPEKLEYLLKKYHTKTRFVLDPVSAAKADDVKHLIKYFHTIKPNRHEAEQLAGFGIKNDDTLIKAAKKFHDEGVTNVFISLDADGIFYSDGQQMGKIKANEAVVRNVTGAGDSFVAGLGYGFMKDLNTIETVRFAIAMSLVTIEHEETIHPDMSIDKVKNIIDKTDWTEVRFR